MKVGDFVKAGYDGFGVIMEDIGTDWPYYKVKIKCGRFLGYIRYYLPESLTLIW